MPENIRRVILIAACIVISGVVISLAYMQMRAIDRLGAAKKEDLMQRNEAFQVNDIVSREGVIHYGAEVVNFIKKMSDDDFPVLVHKTLHDDIFTSLTYYNASEITDQFIDAKIAGSAKTIKRFKPLDDATKKTRLDGLRDTGSPYYINANDTYNCAMIYNVNADNAVVGVLFYRQ